jgi:RND family efflux transporter MFP subunit
MVLAALAVVAGLGVWWKRQQPLEVAVVRAERSAGGEARPVLSGSGYVVTGERYVSIGVRVAGRIDRYFVEEGEHVKTGDPLIQLDDRDYRAIEERSEAELAVARADLALAEAELARGNTLSRDGVISRQELDVLHNKAAVARATVTQRIAALDAARVNREYTLLRAPSDGVVLAKLKEVGEIAVPGGFAGSGDLVRLANMTDVRAEVDVNETDLGRIRMGQAAEVTPDAYPESPYPAKVVKLYPQVDRQKGTLKVEVSVLEPDQRLLPDMSVRIRFLDEPEGGGQPMVLVPADAVHGEDGEKRWVWVVRDGRARRVPVEVGGPVGDRIDVTSGLAGGETLVTSPEPARDGQPVAVGAS